MSAVPDDHPPRAAAPPPAVDRLAPTRRPAGLPVGYQEWRRLLFLHWPVAPEVLRPLVPPGLSLDLFDGVAYVGLIPFFVQAARPLGAPRALGLAFLETNVRTYVHRGGRDPGVLFFSLDAASLPAVVVARLGLGLPYVYARGQERRLDGAVDYRLRRLTGGRPGCRVRYEVGQPIGAAQPGTLDHFLIERYLLHLWRGPTLWTVGVHHQPYPLRAVRLVEAQQELVQADGLPAPSGAPIVHYAAGVDVEIFAPRIRLAGRAASGPGEGRGTTRPQLLSLGILDRPVGAGGKSWSQATSQLARADGVRCSALVRGPPGWPDPYAGSTPRAWQSTA